MVSLLVTLSDLEVEGHFSYCLLFKLKYLENYSTHERGQNCQQDIACGLLF